MKVGFYDVKKRCMVSVEPWKFTMTDARIAAAQMTLMFSTGHHRLPSPIWCVWDGGKERSIFLLDEKPRPSSFLDEVGLSMV